MNSPHLTLAVLTATALFAGCQPKSAEVAALTESVIVGPEFSASKGLFVPEETRRSLGLKVVEITEQKIPSVLECSLRVYEIAHGVARASALLTPEQAKVLQPGQFMQVRAGDGSRVTATITALQPQAQQATGLVELLAEIPTTNRTHAFAAGSFATATVLLATTEPVVTVPRSALVQCTDGYSVYTVSGEHFVRTAVKVGALDAERAEIKDGLYSGDEVVSEPVMSLWLTELAAVKGGHACCVMPAKGK